MLKNQTHLKPWLQDFKKYRNIEKLERNIAVALIDRIIVHGKDEISIIFHYQDEMQEMFALAGLTDESADREVTACVS